FLFYFLYQSNETSLTNNFSTIILKSGIFVVLLVSFIIFNFFVLGNNLTKVNNFGLLLFSIFFILFPRIFGNLDVLIAHFFLLLSLRRLIALQNLKFTKEKIFDASFWIFIAALFHFWCIVYIILVFISIIFHVSKNYKNWIIPFLAFFAVAILTLLIDLIFKSNLLKSIYNDMTISFKFSYFENIYQNIALAIFSAVALLFFLYALLDLSNKPLNMQITFKKIIFAFLLGVLIYMLSNHKNNSFLIFCFAPLSILGANFLEKIATPWMKETTLYLLTLIAISIFLIQL
ncbi:MAG TPA: hypothetical protein DDZ41_06225, partial [Flavobacterium sp.]|nr:hypothetical protein [Flavobacterium sp.]